MYNLWPSCGTLNTYMARRNSDLIEMRIVIKITFKIYFGLHLLRRYSLTRVTIYNFFFLIFEYIEPHINGAHQWTLRRPCSQIFPLEIHLWYELKSCYRGKGLHQKNESRQLLLVCGLVPRAITEPLPWSCYYVCRVCVRSPGILPAPAHLKERDSSGVVLPRVRSSAWQKS